MSFSSDSNEYRKLFHLFRNGLRQSVVQWFTDANLLPAETLSVIENLLRDIGNAWVQGEIPLTTIYVTAKISEEITAMLSYSSGKGVEKKDYRIVLGSVREDYHSLGKNLVKQFLSPFFEVFDLGTNVDTDVFVEKAREVEADIIAVSALMMNAVNKIPNLRELIDTASWKKKPKLLVGGASFTISPRLYQEVGADAYAASAFHAVEECWKLLGVDKV